jgi:hypothetical protein
MDYFFIKQLFCFIKYNCNMLFSKKPKVADKLDEILRVIDKNGE